MMTFKSAILGGLALIFCATGIYILQTKGRPGRSIEDPKAHHALHSEGTDPAIIHVHTR